VETLWAHIQRYSRHIAIIPAVLGIVTGVLSGRTVWLEIGAVWFLGVVALVTGTEMFLAVRRKLPPRRRRGALVEFLQTGGYSLAAASMAVFFAHVFWTSYRPNWLMGLVLIGIVMCFSSALVYRVRPRKARPKHN
jgi:uncharacterized membrane protein